MKYPELLIKHMKKHLERATDIDENGVPYWVDLTIPACDLQDLDALVKCAERELKDKEWDELFSLLKAKVTSNDSEMNACWAHINSKECSNRGLYQCEPIFEDIHKLYVRFKEWYKGKK